MTNGLKVAKERGVQIGRKKTRPSQLIRRLRKSGMTYREISKIANISQGAVAAEMRAWNNEKKMGIDMPLADDLPKEETIDNKVEATVTSAPLILSQQEMTAMAEPFKVIKS